MTPTLSYPSLPHRQRGAVLAIGLLILVIMTLIGVTTMSTSGLEIKMAGNLKDWNLAFQAVEAGMRDAETDITTTGRVSGKTNALDGCAPSGGPIPDQDGQCLTPPGATEGVWKSLDWTDSASTKKYVVYGAKTQNTIVTGFTPSQGYAAKPRYIIEPIATFKPGDPLGATPVVKTFRITAVGFGGSTEANVMSQSTYVIP